jgi:prepilin-type N-terminal cleavage/methylation domain-containing protein
MFKRFRKNKKGFTLIELVVVIGILGVLALLITPNVVNRIDEAKETVLMANIKVLNNAIKMYYTMEGTYPSGEDVPGVISELKNKGYLDEDIDNELINQMVLVVDSTTGAVKIEKKASE